MAVSIRNVFQYIYHTLDDDKMRFMIQLSQNYEIVVAIFILRASSGIKIMIKQRKIMWFLKIQDSGWRSSWFVIFNFISLNCWNKTIEEINKWIITSNKTDVTSHLKIQDGVHPQSSRTLFWQFSTMRVVGLASLSL